MEKLTMNQWLKLNEEANREHEAKVQAILNREFDLAKYEAEFEAEMAEMEIEAEEVQELPKGNNTRMRLAKHHNRLVESLNKVLGGYEVTIKGDYVFQNGEKTTTVATQKEVLNALNNVEIVSSTYLANKAEYERHLKDFEEGAIKHCEFLWRTRYLTQFRK